MRVSTKWLRELVELDASVTVASIAERLTLSGLEVEGVEDTSLPFRGVVVGRVLEKAPHPNAERLSVCRVDIGGETRPVVCGATNFEVGSLVAFATEGTTLQGGLVIKRSTIRGENSEGMLCSEKELGLSSSHDGILILPDQKGTEPGVTLAAALGRDDVVMSIGVTPNRPDALSMIGIAREVAIAFESRSKVAAPTCAERGGPIEQFANVTISDVEGCPRYACRVVEDVKIGPSPTWLIARLAACGIRSVSNVVDVTNLVMMERGLPLHAFDLDKLGRDRDRAEIIVRSAKPGETMTTLDDKVRTLEPADLVIADPKGAVALAGVMGGSESEVSSSTTRILLEAAHFYPSRVRRTARRMGLHSEASHRFERGADPNGVRVALDRAASLIADLTGGRVCRGIIDNYPKKIEPLTVNLRPTRVAQITGLPPKDVDEGMCSRVLLGLGLEVAGRDGDALRFKIPTWRPDLTREIDLIEEIARIHGYEKIASTLPARSGEARGVFDEKRGHAGARSRRALFAAGYSEAVNLAFVSPSEDALFCANDVAAIRLQNPLGEEMSLLRRSLLPGLIRNVRDNVRKGNSDVRLFEIATTFLGKNPEGTSPVRAKAAGGDSWAIERTLLAAVLCGERGVFSVDIRRTPADFFDLKGALEELCESLGLDVGVGRGNVRFTASPTARHCFHPRSCTTISVDNDDGSVVIGHMGELHPDVVGASELDVGVVAAEIDLDVLKSLLPDAPRFSALPRFPSVRRDLAMIVDETLAVDDLCRTVTATKGIDALLEDVSVFDVFRGGSVNAGKKSIAISFVLRATDRTLTDDEIAAATSDVVSALVTTHQAVIRGG